MCCINHWIPACAGMTTKINGYILTFLTIAKQQRAACLPAAGTSENNLNIQESSE